MAGGDHMYTTDEYEVANAVQTAGYQEEGIAAFVFATSAAGTVPLYCLYNPATKDHRYTTNIVEFYHAGCEGCREEGIICYVYRNPTPDTVPFRRFFNPQTQDHLYLVSDDADITQLRRLGYQDEGIACYVYRMQHPHTVPLYRLYLPSAGSGFDVGAFLTNVGTIDTEAEEGIEQMV